MNFIEIYFYLFENTDDDTRECMKRNGDVLERGGRKSIKGTLHFILQLVASYEKYNNNNNKIANSVHLTVRAIVSINHDKISLNFVYNV